jgi:endonuclease/exonuclease/phosphatase family metal-dependent hydrolase
MTVTIRNTTPTPTPTPTPTAVDLMKTQFLDWVGTCSETNHLSSKPHNSFRLATYNIHYFTDIYEQVSKFDEIMNDIDVMNVDCIGLQEILIGGEQVAINKNLSIDVSHFFVKSKSIGFHKHIICNSVPSWYDGIYGNAMLIRDSYCADQQCTGKDLDEKIYTYDKAKTAVVVSGGLQGTPETRCYIYSTFSFTVEDGTSYDLHIYNTHLDVGLESERVAQIKTLIDVSRTHTQPNDVVFIMGDFNSFNKKDVNHKQCMTIRRRLGTDYLKNWKTIGFTKDNGQVVETLLGNQFIDCHSAVDYSRSAMTTWNNSRVDFIFCNKRMNVNGFTAEFFYTPHSDHIPVVLTLNRNITFESPPLYNKPAPRYRTTRTRPGTKSTASRSRTTRTRPGTKSTASRSRTTITRPGTKSTATRSRT